MGDPTDFVESLDFVEGLGEAFVAHRLRRLSEALRDSHGDWLPEAGVTAPARSLSTLLYLDRHGPAGAIEIARALKLSHPLLIKLIAALEALGLVAPEPDSDRRRRTVALTTAGREQVARIEAAEATVRAALRDLGREAGLDLAAAATALEAALRREPFADRLRRAR